MPYILTLLIRRHMHLGVWGGWVPIDIDLFSLKAYHGPTTTHHTPRTPEPMICMTVVWAIGGSHDTGLQPMVPVPDVIWSQFHLS